MPVRRQTDEAGFTMIMTVIGLSVIAATVLVAVTSVRGDIHLASYDLDQKRAYEAAKAAIDNYAYHLNAENSYWTSCDQVPAPSAVNQQGKTEKRLPVPGGTGAEYAIEMLPSTTQAKYTQCSTSDPTLSMLESSGMMKGTFRIRSTGFAGDTEASIVATFKPASFLDYVYFTQRETSDPVTYGSEALINAAYVQCWKTIAEKRYENEILSGQGYCDTISFVSGDTINGPMHTNDAFVICGSPTLGRTDTDPIEVSAPPTGWFSTVSIPHSGSSCNGSSTNFKGTFTANSATLTPPPTNTELKNLADAKFRYKGQHRLCLSGNSMTVMKLTATGTCASPSEVVYTGSLPPNGIVYFEDGVCSSGYTPFNVSYAITEPPSECGNVYVQGNYTGQLTIAAQSNIIVTNNICLESCETKLPFSGTGVLGLVANNFVRIYHPHTEVWSSSKNKYVCSENATGTLENVRIDGAILAIDHSFIVDDYNCGKKLGTLTVNGAIAQKYRGAVGTTGSNGSGYLKSYNYDDRLRYLSPPSFIEPEKTAWVIGRATLD
jgi:type II secretory pathway pseudopilin PulG